MYIFTVKFCWLQDKVTTLFDSVDVQVNEFPEHVLTSNPV